MTADWVKDRWTTQDGRRFVRYLATLARPDKQEWERRIVATAMPLLAIDTPTLEEIARTIAQGNWLSFLDLDLSDYYECLIVRAKLIARIKQWDILQAQLNRYVPHIDCWATCDCLKVHRSMLKQPLWNRLGEYLQSPLPFVRRVGIVLGMGYIGGDYTSAMLQRLGSLLEEKDYYVNMAAAWALCECFIKSRDLTLAYWQPTTFTAFVNNKAISKCRDSYRVSPEDKQRLLSMRQK